jgi:hypothetical protein
MEAIPDGPEGIILEALLEGYERSNGHKINQLKKNAHQKLKTLGVHIIP